VKIQKIIRCKWRRGFAAYLKSIRSVSFTSSYKCCYREPGVAWMYLASIQSNKHSCLWLVRRRNLY